MNPTDTWHIIIVEEGEEGMTQLFHPESCPVTVTSGKDGSVLYGCATAENVSNAGFYGMFDDGDWLKPGVWRVRPWIEKIVGPDWTEWDGGWFTEAIGSAPNEESDHLEATQSKSDDS